MTPKADLRVLSKDWPKASPVQAKRCREGGRRCPRCAALMAAGVNPYTLEPLDFPPFPPPLLAVFGFAQMLQPRRNRPHDSVTQQDSQKGTHQRRRYFLAQGLRRPAQRLHRDHHPQHRRYNSQSRQCLRHGV